MMCSDFNFDVEEEVSKMCDITVLIHKQYKADILRVTEPEMPLSGANNQYIC